MEGGDDGPCKASTRAGPFEQQYGPPCRLESSAGHALCRADGPGRGVEPRRPTGRVVKAPTNPTPHPIPTPQPVTEASKLPKVSANSKTARPKNSVPKTAAARKPVAAKPMKKAVAIVNTAAAKPTSKLVDPNHCSFNLLVENLISSTTSLSKPVWS